MVVVCGDGVWQWCVVVCGGDVVVVWDGGVWWWCGDGVWWWCGDFSKSKQIQENSSKFVKIRADPGNAGKHFENIENSTDDFRDEFQTDEFRHVF